MADRWTEKQLEAIEKQGELMRLAGQLIQSGRQTAFEQLPERIFGKDHKEVTG